MLLRANLNHQPWSSPIQTLILLQSCKTSKDIDQVHARLITTGFVKNSSLTAKIVLSLSASPHIPLIEFSRYIFFTRHACGNREDDTFLWNAVVKTYSHGQEPIEALWVFCLMLENGVFMDEFSVSLVLKACSRVRLVKEGMQIHGLLNKLEIGSNLFLENCLIALYTRCRCLESARQVFDWMKIRDSVSYNTMIDGYVKGGKMDLARDLFDLIAMEERSLISWNSLISGYAQLEDGVRFAKQLFDEMPERDLISWNSMINGYVKCGRMDDAQALFDKMPKSDMVTRANMIDGYAKVGRVSTARSLFDEMLEKDVVVCNAMMGGYVHNGYFMQALDIFYSMQTEGALSPDRATLLIALSAIAQLGHIEKGVALHLYLQENGIHLDEKLGVALIDMYSKVGSIENAMLVFEETREKSVDHWNAMICGLAIHGMGELAFGLLMEMERDCIKPDDITFIGLLNACGHAGLVKEGIVCFEIMRRIHRLEPKLQHYGCMVDILGRAGHVEEARKFVEEMPIEPNDVIWRTLLNACRVNESLTIVKPVAEHLMSLDSSSSGSYVLLSNTYADLGMWDDVQRIRTLMKKKNLKKIPGCSWIELEGIVNQFFVQDGSHPQVTEIYSLLDAQWMPKSDVSYSRCC
ncbi:hypothetical protein K2173_013402 [Erythroxylum novogranatense]|uniref:Chlororespiratory reduction 4 n=1 Tax=Erythroxylum novogranatense TaxID=1862640 RepID=A0AAV8SA99_9ROSI|nr:hypothetical protein K2173_013402 [Erythroxylum novogranatense]